LKLIDPNSTVSSDCRTLNLGQRSLLPGMNIVTILFVDILRRFSEVDEDEHSKL